MKPKPLKWIKTRYGWRAMTPFGPYQVERNKGHVGAGVWHTTFCGGGTIDGDRHATDDAAKAACEADWDRRVRECCDES